MKVRYPSSCSVQALQAFKCLGGEVILDSTARSFWILGFLILKLNFGILEQYRIFFTICMDSSRESEHIRKTTCLPHLQ